MIPENRIPTHPSIVLKEEFLEPLGLSEVAKHLGLSIHRVHEIICGKLSITPQIAWLLAQVFGTTP